MHVLRNFLIFKDAFTLGVRDQVYLTLRKTIHACMLLGMSTSAEKPFDPVNFNFVRLLDFNIPGIEGVYEFRNNPVVDGKADFMRLNFYMTKDGTFATIWQGLLEAMFTEARLTDKGADTTVLPPDFDLSNAYNEHLFRGHIVSETAAQYILAAFQMERYSHSFPQVLRINANRRLNCEVLEKLPAAIKDQ